jgi:putative zinc finger protein
MAAEVTCREFLTFLAEYVSGGLPAAQRDVFREHLAYVNNYLAIVSLARRAREPLPDEVPRDLVKAILAARVVPLHLCG